MSDEKVKPKYPKPYWCPLHGPGAPDIRCKKHQGILRCDDCPIIKGAEV